MDGTLEAAGAGALDAVRALLTTRGDLLVRGASTPQRLALGAINTVLGSDGTDATWRTLTALFDAAFAGGSTDGVILSRNATSWVAYGPATVGAVLVGNASGRPSWQPIYSARVYKSANQSINTTTVTVLSFDTEQYDNNALHDNVTNNSRLTAPIAGRYLITGSVGYAASATGSRQARISKNGVVAAFAELSSAGALITHVPVAVVLDMAANDYVELSGYQDSGGAVNVLGVNAYDTWFGMAPMNGN